MSSIKIKSKVYFANGNIIDDPTPEQYEEQHALNAKYWEHFSAARDHLLATMRKPLSKLPPAKGREGWRAKWEQVNNAARSVALSKMKGEQA